MASAAAPVGTPQNHYGDLKGKTMDKVASMSCQVARDEAVSAMLIRWPWYGHFSMNLGIVETKQIPIAACGWEPNTGRGNLFFHPDNFPRFDLKTRVFAIVHELTHWINLHCQTHYRGQLVNIAMDMAVNSLLASLTPVPLTPTHPEEFITVPGVWHSYAQLEPGLKQPPECQSWEWYYNWLLDRKKNIQNKLEQLCQKLGLPMPGSGQVGADGQPTQGQQDADNLAEGVAPGLGDKLTNHDMWNDLTEAEKDLVKQYVAAAAEQASSNARPPGQIAGHLNGLIEACKPKADWRRYIKNVMGMSGDVEVEFTRAKLNKYNEIGRITLLPTGEVVVAQDTSGSVPDDELALFWGAVEDISKRLNVTTYVMQVDYDVHSFEKFKQRPKGKGGYDVKGREGTRMPAIFDYLNEHPEIKARTVVVCTDGWTDFPTVKQVRGRTVLWVITHKEMYQKFPHNTGIGTAVWLDPQQKKVAA